MSTERDGADARADRRWLIGIVITLLFGIFGAVMAILSYRNSKSNDGPGPATPAAATVAPGGGGGGGGGAAPADPGPRGRGKGKKKDD